MFNLRKMILNDRLSLSDLHRSQPQIGCQMYRWAEPKLGLTVRMCNMDM